MEIFDDAASAAALEMLSAEARALWSNAGGSRAVARSFWIAKDDVARCALERFALEVANFHFNDAESMERVLGCEFWVQLRNSDDGDAGLGLEFHFDKDEDALKTWDVWAHPELATATYIGDGGGAPLVVFATSSDFETEADGAAGATGAAPSPSNGWVCFPRRGRHATFAGNLLHGVPAELCALTLPVATAEEQTASATASTKRARSTRTTREGSASGAKRRKSSAPAPSSSSSLSAPPPPPPPAAASYERLSVLVNIWTSHRPEGVERLAARALCSPAPDATNADEGCALGAAAAGSSAADGNADGNSAGALFTPGVKTALRVVAVTPATPTHTLSEHQEGDTGKIPVAALVELRRSAEDARRRGAGASAAGSGASASAAMELVYKEE